MSFFLGGRWLDLCDADGFGIHFFGISSSGKTTAATITASIRGPPDRCKRSWRTTVNGLEGVAAAQNEVLLVLDELKQAAAEDIAQGRALIVALNACAGTNAAQPAQQYGRATVAAI